MEDVERKEDFNQVCVWEGTIVGEDKVEDFKEFMLKEMDVRIHYLEEIKTLPDQGSDGRLVKDTGGRNDVFFAVHDDDVMKFAIPRLQMGIRWIEDVLDPGNYKSNIYPDRVFEYKTWSCDEEEPVVEVKI